MKEGIPSSIIKRSSMKERSKFFGKEHIKNNERTRSPEENSMPFSPNSDLLHIDYIIPRTAGMFSIPQVKKKFIDIYNLN